MSKIILYFCFCSFLIFNSPLISKENKNEFTSIYCDKRLQKCFKKILKLQEAKSLISTIQLEGPIQIVENDHQLSKQFGAFWDVDQRRICVNVTSDCTEGQLIGSILFELHNAAVNSKIQYFDSLARTRNIDRESYIREIEHLEYENSLKASALSKKGIKSGLFPKDAYLPTYSSFEEHYQVQQMGGHSAWIGNTYDQLAYH